MGEARNEHVFLFSEIFLFGKGKSLPVFLSKSTFSFIISKQRTRIGLALDSGGFRTDYDCLVNGNVAVVLFTNG